MIGTSSSKNHTPTQKPFILFGANMTPLECAWQERYDAIMEIVPPDMPVMEGDIPIGVINDLRIKKTVTLAELLFDELMLIGQRKLSRQDVSHQVQALLRETEVILALMEITSEKINALMRSIYGPPRKEGRSRLICSGWQIVDRRNDVAHPRACRCQRCRKIEQIERMKRKRSTNDRPDRVLILWPGPSRN